MPRRISTLRRRSSVEGLDRVHALAAFGAWVGSLPQEGHEGRAALRNSQPYDEACVRTWEAHGEVLLAAWRKRLPCSRPPGWWRFVADATRPHPVEDEARELARRGALDDDEVALLKAGAIPPHDKSPDLVARELANEMGLDR